MDFTDFDLRIGTVREATQTGEVLELVIDFGGLVRTAESRITERYSAEDMLGRQVVAVTNAPGGSAVVLAAVSPSQGAVLLQPEIPVVDGTQVV